MLYLELDSLLEAFQGADRDWHHNPIFAYSLAQLVLSMGNVNIRVRLDAAPPFSRDRDYGINSFLHMVLGTPAPRGS